LRLPWQDKTGLAKVAAVLSTVLTIAAGLCGVNWVVIGRSSGPPSQWWVTVGIVEAIVIAVCLLALIVVRLIQVIQRLREHFGNSGRG
jgi:hypothetical protein